MNYLVFDEEGRITQSNKLFGAGADTYGALLSDRGLDYVVADVPNPLSMEDYYVSNGILLPRQNMPITLSATTMVANGIDGITISGIPEGAQAEITMMYTPFYSAVITAGVIELSADNPGQYGVSLKRFPYKDWSFTIEAH